METLILILFYSTLVLAGLSALAAAFVFMAKWFVDTSEDPEAAAH